MLKCPYCFEVLEVAGERPTKCPHCKQAIIDELVVMEFKSLDKKKCFFCGRKILKEAIVCKFCGEWLNKVIDGIKDFDNY